VVRRLICGPSIDQTFLDHQQSASTGENVSNGYTPSRASPSRPVPTRNCRRPLFVDTQLANMATSHASGGDNWRGPVAHMVDMVKGRSRTQSTSAVSVAIYILYSAVHFADWWATSAITYMRISTTLE
jgi:hypothetical protein